jgi:hypothetical protein
MTVATPTKRSLSDGDFIISSTPTPKDPGLSKKRKLEGKAVSFEDQLSILHEEGSVTTGWIVIQYRVRLVRFIKSVW